MNVIFLLFMSACISMSSYAQESIKELNLRQAEETGLRNNPGLKRAALLMESVKNRFWSSVSLPKPEVNFSYEYIPRGSGLSASGEKTLEIFQRSEFPLIYFLRGSASNKKSMAANLRYLKTKRSVKKQIHTSYYKLLVKKYQVVYARDNAEISADFLKKAKIRKETGEGTNLEMLTASVQLTESQNNLISAENEVNYALSELCFALGISRGSIDSSVVLHDSLIFKDYEVNIDDYRSMLATGNTDIQLAHVYSEIAEKEVDMAWASLLPDLQFGYLSQSIGGNNNYYGVSFGVSVPLWFMFEQRGKIMEASTDYRAIQQEMHSVKNEVSIQFEQAFSEFTVNRSQVVLYRESLLPQAEEVYRTAMSSFSAGESSFLEYLQAKQLLNSVRINYLESLYRYLISVCTIEEITGGNIVH